MQLSIHTQINSFPLRQVFRIARGSKTQADVLTVIVSDGKHYGWGEAVPYARYGESLEGAISQLNEFTLGYCTTSAASLRDWQQRVQQALPAGAARNALDCALWDLSAKQQQQSVAQLLKLTEPAECITAQTLSIDTPDAMAAAAIALDQAPLIKVKLDSDDVVNKVRAIHHASPASQIIIDANEGWSFEVLKQVSPELAALGVTLIEQPLPAGDDDVLGNFASPIPLCADESCHTREGLALLVGKYQAVNIKLDKTGGLTEALELQLEAMALGFKIMVGCMVGSSLAMAPARLLCGNADYVDLDGPLLIASDRRSPIPFEHGRMATAPAALWGGADARTQTSELFESLAQR